MENKDKKMEGENKKQDEKAEEKKQTKPEEKKSEKTEAVVRGRDLPISTKHSMAICRFIKGRTVEEAIFLLNEVISMKRAVPMKGEIPHRKGKGMERGRYPVKASKQFIKLLRQLVANANVNELDIEKTKIECKADRANRPYRRFGSKRFKRSHVTLKIRIKEDKRKNESKKK